jgi:hypothetical protein
MKNKLPNYDQAFAELLARIVHGFIAVDPLPWQMPIFPSKHRGPIRNVRGDNPLDQSVPITSGTSSIHIDSIRNTDIEAITLFFYQIAQDIISSQHENLFSGLAEITEATGMTVDAGGEPLSLGHLNKMLEKMHVDFDEEGNPIPFSIFLAIKSFPNSTWL